MLYAKVLQNKKNDTITSLFYDEHGRDIEPMSLLNKQCYVKAAIKIEGIFIGSKVSIQVKLHEAEVKLKDSGVKRLLRPSPVVEHKAPTEELIDALSKSSLEDVKNKDDEEEKGSLKSDDEDESVPKEVEVVPPPTSSKAPVRRQTKK
jgi:hypothetical protein